MIIVDAILFITIVGLVHYYKSTHPNFLFFCKGAILFLPPDDQQQSQQTKEKQQPKFKQQSKGQQKQGHEIAVIQVQYSQVKTYPFCIEYQRIAMTIASLLGFYLIRVAFSFVLPPISLLPFYILIAIIIYTIKVSVDIFMVSAYKSKTCLLLALGINVFYIFLAFSLSHMQGLYDTTIELVSRDYTRHLQIVLGNTTISWINQYTVLGAIMFINFFITLASIPSIVKFGNWYSKTLKQVYYQQDEQDQIAQRRLVNSTKESTQQAQKQLKQTSKRTISLLNYYLIATLLFAFCSHRFLLAYVPQVVVDILRLVFFIISITIILWTSKDAVQFNGAIAYKFVMQYFQQKSIQAKQALRRKIIPYIYHIWYHFHQFMIRAIIPILLVFLVVHWKYLAVNETIGNGKGINIHERQINYDVECSINTNEMDLIKNLYKCPIKSYQQMEQQKDLITENIISGIIKGQSLIQPPSKLQQRILHYGFINRSFLLQCAELLLWYANITIYSMTVIYVLFLRKTVYEI